MQTLLKKHFGHDQFRPLQGEIIQSVLDQKDNFVLMPTGGGKSLCYQLPALKLSGTTIVISPLIALMKDQVDALKANGLPAAYINSTLAYSEIDQIQREVYDQKIKILYITPERMALPHFQDFLKQIKLSLIAIDEAHCISEWGHDFRPDYRNLKNLKNLFPKTPLIALTATATPKVRTDIVKQLALTKPQLFLSSFNRPNLNLVVIPKKDSFSKIVSLLKKQEKESVIIYCFSRKNTEELTEDLKYEGFKALPYHAGLDKQTRNKNQELFIKDEVNIIVATIAFGMGIDKSNVRLIIHHTFPKSLEGYYQEIGRAGRDGLSSQCVLFYSYADTMKHEFFIDQLQDPKEQENQRQKLDQVIDYCDLMTCRRKYLLDYFGEELKQKNCGGCDVCLSSKETFDATLITQKILSAIIRTGSRFGGNHVIKVLKGSRSKPVLSRNHDQLSVFGIVADFSEDSLKYIVKQLLNVKLIQTSADKFRTLSLTPQGIGFLNNRESLTLPKPPQLETVAREEEINYDPNLFERLRQLRKEIAAEKNLPPFIIFGDISLQKMATYYPITKETFLRIPSVGEQKWQDFGEKFIGCIKSYLTENNLKPLEIPDSLSGRKTKKRLRKSQKDYYATTKKMLLEKSPLAEIATTQKLKEDTIISHVERLLNSGEKIDIDYLKPPEPDFKKINQAFSQCGPEKLRPIYDFLQEKHSYEEIKLVKLFLEK